MAILKAVAVRDNDMERIELRDASGRVFRMVAQTRPGEVTRVVRWAVRGGKDMYTIHGPNDLRAPYPDAGLLEEYPVERLGSTARHVAALRVHDRPRSGSDRRKVFDLLEKNGRLEKGQLARSVGMTEKELEKAISYLRSAFGRRITYEAGTRTYVWHETEEEERV